MRKQSAPSRETVFNWGNPVSPEAPRGKMSRTWGGGAIRRLLISSCVVVVSLNASVAALPIASASNSRQADGRAPPPPKIAALEERPDLIKVDLQSVARLDGLLKVVH